MHMLWLGVLGGMVVSALAPGWIRAATFALAVALSGLLVTLRKLPHGQLHLHLAVPPGLIALAAVAFGAWSWHYARKRALQHLGTAELRNRWTVVRGVSRWGW